MKRIPFCLFAGLLALSIFTNCKKDAVDEGNNNGGDIPLGLSAKIDEKAWEASSTKGIDMGDAIWLIGSVNNGATSITLRLPVDVQPGTYNFPTTDPETFNALYTYAAITTYSAVTGKIIVKKHDNVAKTIEGTFEIECQAIWGGGTVSLSEGKFNMGYQ